jgi:hypothetical protein
VAVVSEEVVVVAEGEIASEAVVVEVEIDTEAEEMGTAAIAEIRTMMIKGNMATVGVRMDVEVIAAAEEELDAARTVEVEDIVVVVGEEVGIMMIVVVVVEDVDEDVAVTNHWIHFACLCRCILAVFRQRRNLTIVLNESETVYEGLVALLVPLLYLYRISGCGVCLDTVNTSL